MNLPAANEIHIWNVSLNQNYDLKNSSIVLSELENIRASKFFQKKDQIKYITRHLILRKILADYLNCKPEEIIYSFNKFHKPAIAFPAKNNLYFNSSSSADSMIIGISTDCEIGIDIEFKKNIDNINLIALDNFSDVECQNFFSLPENKKQETFFKIWTMKEALIKAIGLGFHFPAKSFTVTFEKYSQISNPVFHNEEFSNNHWTIQGIQTEPDYFAAIATEKKSFTLNYFNY